MRRDSIKANEVYLRHDYCKMKNCEGARGKFSGKALVRHVRDREFSLQFCRMKREGEDEGYDQETSVSEHADFLLFAPLKMEL